MGQCWQRVLLQGLLLLRALVASEDLTTRHPDSKQEKCGLRNLSSGKEADQQVKINKILRNVLFSKAQDTSILKKDEIISQTYVTLKKKALEEKVVPSINHLRLDEDPVVGIKETEDKVSEGEKQVFEKNIDEISKDKEKAVQPLRERLRLVKKKLDFGHTDSVCAASETSRSSRYSGFSCDSYKDPPYAPTSSKSSETEDDESTLSFQKEKRTQPLSILGSEKSVALCITDTTNASPQLQTKEEPPSLQKNSIELDADEHEVEMAIRRNYTDKRDFCMFCEKDVSHFSRHLLTWHSSELEVERIQSFGSKSKERKDALSKLRKQGNFIKNRTSNKIRPVKRLQPSSKANADDFLPCMFCLGYYKRKSLYRHTKLCNQNPNKAKLTKRQTAQSDGQTTLLLNTLYKHDQLLKTELFPRMRADEVTLTVKKDPLICQYAYSYIKGRKSKGNLDFVRQNARRLAKLLMFAKKSHGTEIRELIDLLRPYRFETIVNGINKIAKYNCQTERYESPTLAMNFGTLLKKCCDLGYIHLLQQKADTNAQRKELKILKRLIESKWADEVSAQAATNLNENRWKKEELIPLSTDIKKLTEYLKGNADKHYSILKKEPKDFRAYTSLKEILYTQIILLNRRRPAEVAQLKVETYKSVNLEHREENELAKGLTETERILLQTYNRIVIRGKRGRGVPVLLSPIMKEHFDYLINIRGHFISDNNYVFHTSGKNCIDGTKILQKYANNCGATQPFSITATRLRKHLATVCQLFQFSEGDLEQLSKFMGHTLRTHCNVYRMADSVYQTAKISKLLLLIADGKADEFVGKQLDDINIDLSPVYGNTGNIFEEMSAIPCTSSAVPSTSSATETCETEFIMDREETKETINVSEETEKEIPQKRSKINRKKMVPRQRQAWSSRQKDVLVKYFAKHIKNKQPPKKNECEQLQDLHPELFKDRDWRSMKAVIFNIYHGNLRNY